jgi:two-component system, cell cycle sensor histidine kinase and response regulator CckA
VRVDPLQIEQVLMNLAANARDAMPQGGHLRESKTPMCLHLERRLHPRSSSNRDSLPAAMSLITVSDDGTGIPR